MSNTIRQEIKSIELDSANVEISSRNYIIDANYTIDNKQTITLSTGTLWQTFNFANITTSKYLIFSSDQFVNLRFNGNTTTFDNIKNLEFGGELTGLSIQNLSGSIANISIEMYGI